MMNEISHDIELPKRDEVIEIIKTLPAESALNEIIYHLYVKEQILLGQKDARDGKSYTTEEAKERLKKWFK